MLLPCLTACSSLFSNHWLQCIAFPEDTTIFPSKPPQDYQWLLSLGAKGHLPSGYSVSSLWVLKQFTQQIPTGHIGGYLVNEIRGFVYKTPTGYLVRYIVNEIREFIHNVPTRYWGGYFLKEPSISLVGICQVNCFKTHNELTLCPLGKCPFTPSVCQILQWVHV